MVRIALAGATGWTGSVIARALHGNDDFKLVSALSRTHAGRDLGEVLEGATWNVPIFAKIEEILDDVDVMIEYTGHATVKPHSLSAIAKGVHVVVGSSGMSAQDFAEIDAAAKSAKVGVIAAGNYAITAALAQAAALMVAEHLPQIICNLSSCASIRSICPRTITRSTSNAKGTSVAITSP